jgi:hypothetical protein
MEPKQAPLAGQRLKHQHAEKHTEDEYHQENDQRDEEQYFRDAPRVCRDVGKAEKTGNHGDDEKNKSPLDHGWILQVSVMVVNLKRNSGCVIGPLPTIYSQRRGAKDAEFAEKNGGKELNWSADS